MLGVKRFLIFDLVIKKFVAITIYLKDDAQDAQIAKLAERSAHL
jgi:hypothetical protein